MQKTDLNVSPYYDDYDVSDNFQRVLFRPGFAVQARELATLQSILQNQIERHGRHFFKEGFMVIPGQISFTNSYYAVKLQSTFNSAAISGYLSSYVGNIITGSISGITARVIGVTDATTTDAPTLFVKYLTTATTTAKQLRPQQQLVRLLARRCQLFRMRARGGGRESIAIGTKILSCHV